MLMQTANEERAPRISPELGLLQRCCLGNLDQGLRRWPDQREPPNVGISPVDLKESHSYKTPYM